ncbi:MAG: efflux RND transporter periplasmic adaptor subunit [Phycisphaerales bacterium]
MSTPRRSGTGELSAGRERAWGSRDGMGAQRWVRIGAVALACAALGALSACGGGGGDGGGVASGEHDHEAPSGPTNRIDIPPAVRSNLGITFAQAEVRQVASTLRVPGTFEYTPSARREYRTMLPGRVEILVDEYERVEPGTALYRIDSPHWRELKRQIADAEASILRLTARAGSFGPLMEAHRNHERMLENGIAVRRERVSQLEEVASAGGGRAGELLEARAALASAEAELAEVLEKEAELEADRAQADAELEAAIASHGFLIESAAAVLGVEPGAIGGGAFGEGGSEGGSAVSVEGGGLGGGWRSIRAIVVRAEEHGVVDHIGMSNGGWADQTTEVLTIVRPDELRFRGSALQSDLGRLGDGQRALIVPPSPSRRSGGIDLARTIPGVLTIAPTADANARTIDLIVTPGALEPWARAGVSAQLEVVTDETASAALAIPRAAIQRDGLVPVFFRRDPEDLNKAIRVEADLGIDDGRWIVVNSGLRRGDEIVLDGSFQLMLATAQAGGGMPKGGHFHADGTWHAEDH